MDYPELVRRIESQDRGTCTSTDPEDDSCPLCHGSGWDVFLKPVELYGGDRARFARRCPVCNGNHDIRVRESKALADIPEDRTLNAFDWSIYTGFNLKREKRIIENFVENFTKFETKGMGLFLTSKTRGSGKTFLASCIGGELISRYEALTVFVNASDLLNIAQKKREEAEDPIEKLISCRVLILDDLGQKRTGLDWLTDELFRIIDKRYQKKRITIVTSNEPLGELAFDDRIIDRLYAMTISINLPEYCVRAQEANTHKEQILKELGIEIA